MKFTQPKADCYVPDQASLDEALSRTTHLCIAAHQDDIEIFAYNGIAACYHHPERWFTGVVVTDGAGSSRTGIYASYTDEEMKSVRCEEQRTAACVGGYSLQVQLGYSSALVKDNAQKGVVDDLRKILEKARPEVVYLHNPADKHDTHVAVLARSLAALRALPRELRPKKVYGGEVWRSLDWLLDEDKQVLDTSARPNLASALVNVFDSQICGGKRYDLATIGRRLANATFFESHATDKSDALTWAMDLTPLMLDDTLSVSAYTAQLIQRFQQDVEKRIGRYF
ncbi:MAG: PIG-L family deacetylase [Verrucomicrobia bacterium Tous-C9LFEB]|nr:MAG: PIG-L family deacetylase [Verrucomicrobia bacterium Tous-C9LFEB]